MHLGWAVLNRGGSASEPARFGAAPLRPGQLHGGAAGNLQGIGSESALPWGYKRVWDGPLHEVPQWPRIRGGQLRRGTAELPMQ